MWEEAKGKETLASPLLQQFLRASLATMEDEAWTKGLSCELSRWLSSSPSSSGEKVGSPRLYPAVQPQVPNWRRGCGWCSAHTGRSRCFPGPCPPEGLSLQTAWGWLKLGPAPALSVSQGAWVLPTWPSPSRSGCCHISASSFPSHPFSSLPMQSFLYKALGTVLGACKEVLHIQGKLLQHLEEANAEEPSEAQVRSPPSQLLPASPVCPLGRGLLLALLRAFRSPHCCAVSLRRGPAQPLWLDQLPAPTAPCSFVQGMISLLSHAAESNFHTALDTLTMFASRLCRGQNGRISRRKKVKRYAFPSWLSAALFSLGSPGALWGTGGC